MSEYVDVEVARGLPGMRLVLTAGVPGPWGESAKGILHVKGIPFVRVAQQVGGANPAIYEWTGVRNAPVAVYDDLPPRSGWAEILWLAERLAPEPRLVPTDPDERVLLFGLGAEICGENGLGWSRRLMIMHGMLSQLDDDALASPPPALAVAAELARRYGYSRAAGEAASQRVVEILDLLSRQLTRQRERGRSGFIGEGLTALDIWWAAFAALFEPLPDDLCPMAPGMRATYTVGDGPVRRALHPILLEHRDRIYRDHLELPVRT